MHSVQLKSVSQFEQVTFELWYQPHWKISMFLFCCAYFLKPIHKKSHFGLNKPSDAIPQSSHQRAGLSRSTVPRCPSLHNNMTTFHQPRVKESLGENKPSVSNARRFLQLYIPGMEAPCGAAALPTLFPSSAKPSSLEPGGWWIVDRLHFLDPAHSGPP